MDKKTVAKLYGLESNNNDIEKVLKHLKHMRQSMDKVDTETQTRDYINARNAIVVVIDMLQASLDGRALKDEDNI